MIVSVKAVLIDSSNYLIMYSRINAVTIPVRLFARKAISPPKNLASKSAQEREIYPKLRAVVNFPLPSNPRLGDACTSAVRELIIILPFPIS